jgi:acetolactate synthase I/II/III large subunit
MSTYEETTDRAEMTGAAALVASLERAGVEVVFGVAGHTNVAFLDELSRSSIRYVGARHEQIAVHAADGYFRVTHKPAVVLTTSGPGMTNTIAALGDAALDCSAMVVICGEPQSYYAGREGFQEVTLHSDTSQWEIARPIVKRAWRVSHPDVLTYGVATAFRIATSDAPGPVLMSVPLDIFSHKQAYEIVNVPTRKPTGAGPRPNRSDVEAAAELIAGAERPIIFAGGGAVLADATEAITALAERLDCPVVTTLSGQGAISKYHPLYGGFISPFGTKPGHALLRAADRVLIVGSRLAEFDLSSWSPDHTLRVPPMQLIQIDIDATVIGRQYDVSLGLEADARLALEDILAELGEAPADGAGKDPWYQAPELAQVREEWDASIAEGKASDKRPIQPERLMAELREAMPADGILFCDAGLRGAIAQTFPVDGPRLLHFPSGWGTMGFAVGATLGAKVAEPERVVVAEVGDGGFTSVMGALVTAVEHDIPVVWVVRNNALFSSIAVYHRKHFNNDLFGTKFATDENDQPLVDIASIASAAGAGAIRVDDPDQLGAALGEAISSGRPYVVEVVSEPSPRGRASGYWDVNRVLGEQVKDSVAETV